MANNFHDIRAAIVAKLDELTKVQKTYGYDPSTIEGIPAVIVSPSDNEADYGSTSNDRIVFVFKLRAYYTIEKESEEDEAETALEEVVDEILTAFKERNVLGSACDWVEPAPSIWEYESRGEAVYRVAELTLRCVKYVA